MKINLSNCLSFLAIDLVEKSEYKTSVQLEKQVKIREIGLFR